MQKSITHLKEEKNLDNPILSIADISFPDNGDISKAKYTIKLEPENGGSSFSFYYKLNGELIEID